MDSIQLTGLRCYGYTGYLPEERILGQWFEVDLKLWFDLKAAGQSDRLEDTLDYRPIVSAARQVIETSKYSTIERLAQAIADAILDGGRVGRVQVRLSKTAAPIPNFGGCITVEILRSREEALETAAR
ncbi:MAG: dihydroneopterin aldolase [Cyanobacteriota bacterium]|nr:dihydroneopterin aldolase [Cyanobacteriota bacterium]